MSSMVGLCLVFVVSVPSQSIPPSPPLGPHVARSGSDIDDDDRLGEDCIPLLSAKKAAAVDVMVNANLPNVAHDLYVAPS